jgi:hypothetical protein
VKGRANSTLERRAATRPSVVLYDEPVPTLNFLGGQLCVALFSAAKDNPHLPKNYEQNIRAASRSDAAFLREWQGDFNASEATLHHVAPAHFVRWPKFDPQAFPSWKFLVGIVSMP